MELTRWPDGLPRQGNQKFKKVKSLSSWFEIYCINSNTYAILEPNHDEEVISYLVIGEERAALIDTGMGIGNIRSEVENLCKLPVIVINTHGHFDHIGDNHRFDDVFVFDNEYDIARVEKGYSNSECRDFMGPQSYMNLPQGFDTATYAIRPAKVTKRIRHLENIDLGERRLTIHHTPGHSPGSICLLDSQDRLLFTGDTYYPGTIFAQLPGSDYNALSESARYLTSLVDGVTHLCPAHNEIYAPKEALQNLHQAFEQIFVETTPFEKQNNTRFYSFKRFNLRLPFE